MTTTNIKDKLPTYKASDCVWDKISGHLDYLDKESGSNQLIEKLPGYTAPNLFDSIITRKKKKTNYLSLVKIAASIIIMIGTTLTYSYFQTQPKSTITYSYEQQIPTNGDQLFNIEIQSTEFTTLLAIKCKTSPNICGNKEYEDLYSRLKEIEREEKILKSALEEYNDPNIENHLIRITNDKLKIEKYLLNLFS